MIRYVEGDATRPEGAGVRVIAHVCNDFGGWGAGFVLALSRRWSEPERDYREWCAGRGFGATDFGLGRVRLVEVEPDLWVANMIAQDARVRYGALSVCLGRLGIVCRDWGASVHMPRIGCGLGGGTWSNVEPIIARELEGVDVTVYDLPAR